MERDSSRTAADLNRPEGNSLKQNYSKHDVAQEHVIQHIRDLDLSVEEWGIDMRDDEDGLVFDDVMDLRVRSGDTRDAIVAVTEIKAKTNEDWFGIINLRHYKHYLAIRNEYDCPVYIYMALVDEDDDADDDLLFDSDSGVIKRDAFIPLHEWDGEPLESPQITRDFSAPDGNTVVKLDPETYVDWTQFGFDLGASAENV